MSDKPTKKPKTGTTNEGMPKPLKMVSKIKETSPGITVIPFPPEPKVSIQKDNAALEAKFNPRGAVSPWVPPGGRAESRGSSDVKAKPVSKRVGDASMGISLKTGYKKIG